MSRCQNQSLRNELFINKAIAVHGDKYSYDMVIYHDRESKIIIKCNICNNVFEQAAYHHLRGSGCPECAKISISNKLKLSRTEFLSKVNAVHGDKYDYSDIIDWSRRSKQTIICKLHGKFIIKIGNLLNGSGCPKCGIISSSNKQRKQLCDFESQARIVHGDKYKYLKYTTAIEYVEIECKIHGLFKQLPKQHLVGKGCPKCVVDSRKHSIDEFISKSVAVHGHKYDYSKSIYRSNKEKLIIICPIHGEFEQTPNNHWTGQNCQLCVIEQSRNTTSEFIDRANIIHNNKYSYTSTNCIRSHDKVIINCSIHGDFEQRPNSHLNGQGCPKCVSTISQPQIDIANFIGEEYILNDRKLIAPYELDIYIPKAMIGIEYHGLYWHSFNTTETFDEKMRHYNKCNFAIDKNIRLIQIFEHHWTHKQDIVKSMLNNILGKSNRIFARNTEIIKLDNIVYNVFMDDNHLYGSRVASVKYGLLYKGEIVACMSFNINKDKWEITRYACKKFNIVIGGVSKLLKYFVTHHGSKLMTFADRSHSLANAYIKNGFKIVGITKPNYFYIKGNNVYSRQQFQKHKLHKKLQLFDPALTESENMFNNGFRRIWDAGHYKLEYQSSGV